MNISKAAAIMGKKGGESGTGDSKARLMMSEKLKESWNRRAGKFPYRFWRNVEMGHKDECWPWKGYCGKNRYGMVFYDGKLTYTHRLAWTLTYGDPGEKWVLHHCDNPKCCNPYHLFLGDHSANMADMTAKGRHHKIKGEQSWSHKLTKKQVLEIREKANKSSANLTAIAKEYGVAESAICNIVHRKRWKHF